MGRLGGGRHAGLLVLLAALAGGALPLVRAQDAPPAPPGDVLRLEAEKTELRREEACAILLGEAHVRFESSPGRAPKDRHVLDVRAEYAVAFLSSETELRRGATPVRALYAEGHARLEQRSGTGAPFVLEAARLWIDLVNERAYAVDAVARAPATRSQAAVGPPGSSPPPARPASFTLRAERLRLEGTAFLEGEGCALSACDYGLPHEALEAARVVIVERAARAGRPLPGALATAAALGGPGATTIARRAESDQPFRAFRDVLRGRASRAEGSDAIFHAARGPRLVEVEGSGVRVRPPFFPSDGLGVPFPIPLAWETDWPLPDVRIGHSSRFGWFELAELRVPLWRPDLVHGPRHEGTEHVRQGLELDALGGGGFYETRGGTGTGGGSWAWFDATGQEVVRGDARGTYVHDRAPRDRNGSPLTDEDRYWIRGLHQQELPLGVHLDAEVSKQSDANYLREYERSVAFNEKEQETYAYLRRSWDDLGARLTGKWRLNDFQTQTEELPRARIDWIDTPLHVHDTLGGLYLSSAVEGAHLRARMDERFPDVPDERLGRGDLEGRLDYKLSVLDVAYARAFGLGRFTAWSHRQGSRDSIERFLGSVGVRVGTQADGVFSVSERVTLRHVIVPEVGYEDRLLVTRAPESLVPIDEVETYRAGSFAFGRLRNRLQWAASPMGKDALDVLDVSIEGRYFPERERLAPQQRIWGTVYGDGRLYLGRFGALRCVAEVDPNRHRLLRLEETVSWAVTRSVLALADARTRRPYPDVSLDASYREVVDVARAVGWGASVRLTPAWSFRVDELYDFRTDSFLRHRVTVRRDFHGFAIEVSGSHDPILRDTTFSVGITPSFDPSTGE